MPSHDHYLTGCVRQGALDTKGEFFFGSDRTLFPISIKFNDDVTTFKTSHIRREAWLNSTQSHAVKLRTRYFYNLLIIDTDSPSAFGPHGKGPGKLIKVTLGNRCEFRRPGFAVTNVNYVYCLADG